MRPSWRFWLKKLLLVLPGFLRKRVEQHRMLTLLSRELIFSTKFTTPGERRAVTRQYIQLCARELQQPWPDLLSAAYEASRLPAAADEAYRLRLQLESAVSKSGKGISYLRQSPSVHDEDFGALFVSGRKVLTIIIRLDESDLESDELLTSLQSLQAQRCALWELQLVIDESASLGGLVGKLLESGQAYCVSCIEEACREAAGLLLHELSLGDCLHPDLVAELARYLVNDAAAPGTKPFDILYTDHDHLDVDRERCQPVFKPDWNPDLLANYDYIGPSLFWRTGYARTIDNFSVSQVQSIDLVRSIANHENVSNPKIIHIQKLLYHRRGTVSCSDSYGNSAAGTGGYDLPEPLPEVTLIIPTRDRLEILQPCIESILQKTAYPAYHVLIVDNQSKDPATIAWLRQATRDTRITVVSYDQPFNYADMNNFAVQQSSSEIVGLLNNDVEVINSDWLQEMVMHACRPEIGCVGAKLYYSDGRIQHAGVVLGANGGSAHSHRYFAGDADGYCGRLKLVQNVSAVTGACLLLRRELFEQVGGLEAEHLPIAWNDIDLCLKVQAAGYRNLWTPYAELYHHESVSRGRDVSSEQRKRYQAEKAWMQQRWGEALWRDPYYNQNLTATQENFALNMLAGISG